MIFIQACSMVAFPGVVPVNVPDTVSTPVSAAAPEAETPTMIETSRIEITSQVATKTVAPPSVVPPSATRTAIRVTPTSRLSACLRAGGSVEVHQLATGLLPEPLVYRIYLPPCYEQDLKQTYPVLYLIHGQTFDETQWQRLGVPEAADGLIASGEARPFIVVMPRDESFLEPDGDYFGLAVEQALVPWVDGHYRTIPEREFRAIGGLSRGAAWAAHIGLSHPELFSAIGMHSGFIFYGEVQEVPRWLEDVPEGMMPKIYMDVGDEDAPEISTSAKWLEELLTQYGIPHEWHMFVGEHEEAYWSTHVEDYLRWYTQNWAK